MNPEQSQEIGQSEDLPSKTAGLDPKASFMNKLLERLEVARGRLVDRNLRNRLISTNLNSSRTKNIRFFNGSNEDIFNAIYINKHEMLFSSSDDSPELPIKLIDSNSKLDEISNDSPSLLELNQPQIELDDTKEQLKGSSKAIKTTNVLETRLEKISLQKKLKSLYYEAKEYEEEQGVNILFVALGFVKWYEDDKSDIERYAPLVLLPVELIRDGAKDKYKLRPRDEDLFTNISLKLWLKEQNNIELPDLPEEDPWSYTEYCQRVSQAISHESRWGVLKDDVVLGFFSFNKFLLWRDLDPANWPAGHSLLDHPIVQRLLMPPPNIGEPDPPIVDPDELIDDFFTPQDLVYVVDADSSQTEAIQTVLSGKDLVIQGPPGTGKSQTITNIIAAAVAEGKSVLFIAEKMAALNVVHDRLTKVGLNATCLELHSRKATKSAVLKQIGESVEFPPQPLVSEKAFITLHQSQTFLNNHAKSINNLREPWAMSPSQVMGEIAKLHRLGLNIFNFDIPDSIGYTRSKLDDLTSRIDYLCERLKKSGVPINHPWRLSEASALTPMDIERLEKELNKLADLTASLQKITTQALQAIGFNHGDYENKDLSTLEWLGQTSNKTKFPPDVPYALLVSDLLRKNAESLKGIAILICKYRADKSLVGQNFISSWEGYDLASLRVKLAGSGGSIFSIFNSTYRESIRNLKGLMSGRLPDGFANRLALIDSALALKSSKEAINNYSPEIRSELSSLWFGVDSNDELLLSLCDWFSVFEGLDAERLNIATKLVGNESAHHLMDDLSSALANFERQLTNVCSTVKVDIAVIKRDGITDLGEVINCWRDNLYRLNEWPSVRGNLLDLLPVIGQDCYNKIYQGEIQADHINSVVRSCILEKIWQSMISADSYLSEIDAFKLNRELEIFRRTDKERLKIAAKEILGTYSKNSPRGNSGEMAIIRQEMAKKRNNLAVRKLMQKAGRAIHELKPVFLMSPMSIAQFIAPGAMTFDLVLIDEASQVRPEDALGAIARARQVVVVGDAKQLPPTNFFNRLTDESDHEEILDDEGAYLLSDVESILGLCDGVFQNKAMLRWHYRSQHPGLIAVSNRNFYDNKLLLPPSVLLANYSDGFGVSFVKSPQNGYIRGGSEGGRNILEAQLIAQEVIAFAKANPTKSLGVAAFSVTQRDCIRDLIDAERLKHPETETFFSGGNNEPFFVKNLESIQGDERDVIFISVGYGRSEDGRLTQTFGPLAAEGGERRLNVLISRAKERCTVFSSITAEDIKNASGKIGVNAFKEFLQFAEKGYFDVPINTEKGFDSDFEESVAIFLTRHGYKVQPQVGMSGFFIDLGVIDPNNDGKYYCGIECDGATYHSSRSARDRDCLRQEILESRGWKIYRIWSTDWFHRRQDQEARLLDYLLSLSASADDQAHISSTVKTQEEVAHDIYEPISEVVEPDICVDVPYVEFDELTRTNKAPHELSAYELSKIIRKIVDLEAPIHQEEIARRLARSFGLEKAGNRIQSATLDALIRHQFFAHKGEFWITDAPVKRQVRIRTNVKSRTLLNAGYLPPEEILLALSYVVKQSVQIDTAELIQQCSRLFGFQRCGPELKEVINSVIDKEIGMTFNNFSGLISLKR